MSNYYISTLPEKGSYYAYWENGFTNEEISEIIKVGESINSSEGTLSNGVSDSEIRRSKTSWLTYDHLPWLYDKMAYINRMLNFQYFNYEITGFHEDFQYTVYESNQNGFYDWHMDCGDSTPVPRKLSMVLLLSDESEYEGGNLLIQTGNKPLVASKTKGIVHVFPSFILHKVEPITKGTRKSLVVWSYGPSFK